jgi:signal transduction histidine kinase
MFVHAQTYRHRHASLSRMQSQPDTHYPIPADERERLEELYRYSILDTPSEEFFDHLTQLAARTFDVPIALISLVDRDRQWFKSHHGIAATQTPREHAFCAHTILSSEPLVVEDATADSRFANNVFVLGDPSIRFYAAVPLVTSRGFAIGSLCVIDRRPRTATPEQLNTLRLLSVQIVQQFELRQVAETLRRQSLMLEKVQSTAQIGGWEVDLRTRELTWTEETYRIHGLAADAYKPTVESAIEFYTPETRPLIRHAVEAAALVGSRFDLELQILRQDATNQGERRWVRAIGRREEVAGQAGRLVGVIQDITERRLLEREIVLIAQREQNRISSDLHDGLGQELTGISLMLSGLLTRVPESAETFRTDLRNVETLVRHAVGSCRSLAQGVSPTGREHGGLVAAVRELGARIAKLHGIRVLVRTRGQNLGLGNATADHLYRIVQEAMTNAIKHGHARRVVVCIEWNARRTFVSISNDGETIASPRRSEGKGLGIMRYRARLIGATVDIGPGVAGGTRVRCCLPHAASIH